MSSRAKECAIEDLNWADDYIRGHAIHEGRHYGELMKALLQQLNFHRAMEASYFVESIGVHGDGCVDLRVSPKMESEIPPFVPMKCSKCGEKDAVIGGYCSLCDIKAEGNKLCPECKEKTTSEGCPMCSGEGEVKDPDAPKCALCGSTDVDVTGELPMCGPCKTGKS